MAAIAEAANEEQYVELSAVARPEIKLLTIFSESSYNAWLERVKAACISHKRSQWQIGDLLVFGERNFSDPMWEHHQKLKLGSSPDSPSSPHKFTYHAVAEETRYEITALYDIASVAHSVPVSVRTELLTWSHHRCVRALEPVRQKYWLDVAIAWKFTVARLKYEIYQHDDPGSLPQASWINDGEKLLLPPVKESGKEKIAILPKEFKTLEKETHLTGVELRALNKFSDEKHVPPDVAIRALVVMGLYASGHRKARNY
jgi:hypothetical protein